MNYKPGDVMLLHAANDKLHITDFNKTVKNIQALFKQHNTSDSAVDEFLQQKYLEVAKLVLNNG